MGAPDWLSKSRAGRPDDLGRRGGSEGTLWSPLTTYGSQRQPEMKWAGRGGRALESAGAVSSTAVPPRGGCDPAPSSESSLLGRGQHVAWGQHAGGGGDGGGGWLLPGRAE